LRRRGQFDDLAEVLAFMKPVATTFECLCGERLILREKRVSGKRFVVMFGCRKCRCYVVLTEDRVREYFSSDELAWSKLMKDLYDKYLEAKSYICSPC
jgi:hypothetical protein